MFGHRRRTGGSPSPEGAQLLDALRDASRHIRQHLDSEDVLRTSVNEVGRALPATRTTVWLTRGRDTPRLACASATSARTTTADDETETPPKPVLTCSRRRRPAHDGNGGGLAVPILAPRSGMLGVLHVAREAWTPDEERFLAAIGLEAGLALESANLYEQAIAEKDKSAAILAGVGEAVIVTDPRGQIVQWNPAAEQVVGCPAQDAVGHACGQVLGLRMGDEQLDCATGCALLAARDASSPLGVEVWRRRADGRHQPLLASVAVVKDPDGNVADVVHSFRDVTKLKEADEAKTLFLATASHELKTPLTVIYGFAQTLMASPDWEGADRDQALEAMARRAGELNKIVDRLLLSSRIEAGRAEVHLASVVLDPLLEERVRALAASSGREITLEMADGPLPAVRADADAVITVVDHLLDNALKYSPLPSPVVLHAEADNRTVRISVADQGIGMDGGDAAHCFEKFWQAESSDVRRFGGTGIGLFIVRSLVDAMGGEVSVVSQVGQGSTFTVTLPRADASPEAKAADAELLEPGVGEPTVIREFMRQIGIPTRRSP